MRIVTGSILFLAMAVHPASGSVYRTIDQLGPRRARSLKLADRNVRNVLAAVGRIDVA
jgi:hypothetical protein